MAYNTCSPQRIFGPLPQTLFCGCSVLSFSASIGWNEQVSSLDVELVQDECSGFRVWYDENLVRNTGIMADPGFTKPEPGCAAYFRIEEDPNSPTESGRGGFEYAGLIESWNEKRDPNGNPVYHVKIVDPRIILENTQVIVNDFVGGHSGVWNIVNAFGYIESFGTPCLASPAGAIGGVSLDNTVGNIANDRGMVWNDVKCAIHHLTSSIGAAEAGAYCKDGRLVYVGPKAGDEGYGILAKDGTITDPTFTGIPNANLNTQHYLVDLTEVPFGPLYYRISGPDISLMELVSQVCKDAGCDYYVELLPVNDSGNVLKIIKVRTAVRSTQPTTARLDDFIAARKAKESGANGGILNYTKGEEVRNEETSIYLIGGKERNPYTATEGDILPFWGFDTNGDLIQAQIISNQYYARLDVTRLNTSLFTPFSSAYVWVSENEMRAALTDPQSFLFMVHLQNGDLATHFKTLNILAHTVGDLLLDAVENKRPAHDVPVINANIFATQAINSQNEQDFQNIYNFIKQYAQEYYGRYFIVNEPNVCFAVDTASGKLRYTNMPATEGAWVSDSSTTVIGLTHNSTASDFFRDEQGKYQPIVRFTFASHRLGESILNPKIFVANPSELNSNDYISSSTDIWVKGQLESFWVHGTPLSPSASTISFLVKIPAPVVNRTAESSTFYEEYAGLTITADALGRAIPVPDIIARSDFILGMLFLALRPYQAMCPERSNITVYGPWGVAGLPGQVNAETDEGFVPWEYGSDTIMNYAALDKVSNAVTQMRKGERGSVTVAGFPDIPLGAELMAVDDPSPPTSQGTQKYFGTRVYSTGACLVGVTGFYYVPMNPWSGDFGPNITNVSTQIGANGFTTTYQFSTYTPAFGRFSKDNAERLKRIGQARLNMMRNVRANALRRERALFDFGRRERINNFIGRNFKAPKSPHQLILGRYIPYKSSRNRHEINTQFGQDAVGAFQNNTTYSNTSLMSFDGLLRPVSKSGDAGYPRYIQVSGQDCVYAKDSTDQPDPPVNEYQRLDISIDYLDPVANPNTILPNRSDTPGTGHDIEILGRESTPPSGWSIQVGEELGSGGYASDYRFFAIRGPILIQQWGYDLHGKPVPNKADDPTNANDGIFVSGNLQDKFLDAWLQKPETWPVAPLDLRLDRERGVWTTPQPPRNIHVNITGCINTSGSYSPTNLKPVYDSAGNLIASPTVTVEWPWDVAAPSGVGKVPVYYDNVDCKYYAFPVNRLDVTVEGQKAEDVKGLILGSGFSLLGSGNAGCGTILTIAASGGGGSGSTGVVTASGYPFCGGTKEGGVVKHLDFGPCLDFEYDSVNQTGFVNFDLYLKNTIVCCATGTAKNSGCIKEITFEDFDMELAPATCGVVIKRPMIYTSGYSSGCPVGSGIELSGTCNLNFGSGLIYGVDSGTCTATVDYSLTVEGRDSGCLKTNDGPRDYIKSLRFVGFNTSWDSANCVFEIAHPPLFNAYGYTGCIVSSSPTLVGGDMTGMYFGSGLSFDYDAAQCTGLLDYNLVVSYLHSGCDADSGTATSGTFDHIRHIDFSGFKVDYNSGLCKATVLKPFISVSGYTGCSLTNVENDEICGLVFGSGFDINIPAGTHTVHIDNPFLITGGAHTCIDTTSYGHKNPRQLRFAGFDLTYNSSQCETIIKSIPLQVSGYANCGGALNGPAEDTCLLKFGSGLSVTYPTAGTTVVDYNLYTQTSGSTLSVISPNTQKITFSGFDGVYDSSDCSLIVKASSGEVNTSGYTGCPPAAAAAYGKSSDIIFLKGLDYYYDATTKTTYIDRPLTISGAANCCVDFSSVVQDNVKKMVFHGFTMSAVPSECRVDIEAVPPRATGYQRCSTTVQAGDICAFNFLSGLDAVYDAATCRLDVAYNLVTANTIGPCSSDTNKQLESTRKITFSGFDSTVNSGTCEITVAAPRVVEVSGRDAPCPAVGAEVTGLAKVLKFGSGLTLDYDGGTCEATVNGGLMVELGKNACGGSTQSKVNITDITFTGFSGDYDAATCSLTLHRPYLTVKGPTGINCVSPISPDSGQVCILDFASGFNLEFDTGNYTARISSAFTVESSGTACQGVDETLEEARVIRFIGFDTNTDLANCAFNVFNHGPTVSGYSSGCSGNISGEAYTFKFGSGFVVDIDTGNCTASIDYPLSVSGTKYCCYGNDTGRENITSFNFSGFDISFTGDSGCTNEAIIKAPFMHVSGYGLDAYCQPTTQEGGPTCTLLIGSGLELTYDSGTCTTTIDKPLFIGSQSAAGGGCGGGGSTSGPFPARTILFSGMNVDWDETTCTATVHTSAPMLLATKALCGQSAMSGTYNRLTFGSGLIYEQDIFDPCNFIVHGGLRMTQKTAGGCASGTNPRRITDIHIGPGMLRAKVPDTDCVGTLYIEPSWNDTTQPGGFFHLRYDCTKWNNVPLTCDVCYPNPTGLAMQKDGPYCLRKAPKYLTDIQAGHGIGFASCGDCDWFIFNNHINSGVDNACNQIYSVQSAIHTWSDDFALEAGPTASGGCDGAGWTLDTKIKLNTGGGAWSCTIVTGIEVVKSGPYVTDVTALTSSIGGVKSCGGTYWIKSAC